MAFPPEEHLSDTLSAVAARAGIRQLKVVESEKAVHLFYFLNGKAEEAEPNEERVVIPSPKDVANYDEVPELSAKGVSDAVVSGCYGKKHELIIANFANVDVLGHIENEDAILKAVNTVDTQLGDVVSVARKQDFWTIVTADHGTVEDWIYPEGTINTGHTASDVPCIIIPPEGIDGTFSLRPQGGGLTDVAPTILDLLAVDKPAVMTGESLIQWESDGSDHHGKHNVMLLILDGWGHREEIHGNLILKSDTPTFDALWQTYPKTTLAAAGEAVGMPAGAVGNSECGHLHLGAGRKATGVLRNKKDIRIFLENKMSRR